MLGKWGKQSETRLEGEVGLERSEVYNCADRAMEAFDLEGYRITKGRFNASKNHQHYCIHQGERVLSGLHIFPGYDELTDKQGQPTGQRKVFAEWDEAVLDDLGNIASSAEDTNLVKLVGKLANKAVRGVKGFEAYRDYLEDFRNELLATDRDGDVRIVG